MRFVVPIRTVHAGPNPKYFGQLRKILSLKFTLHFDRRTLNALKALVIENDRWLRADLHR
jgi:hypothetical protein